MNKNNDKDNLRTDFFRDEPSSFADPPSRDSVDSDDASSAFDYNAARDDLIRRLARTQKELKSESKISTK